MTDRPEDVGGRRRPPQGGTSRRRTGTEGGEPTIRNQRYRRWPVVTAWLLAVSCWMAAWTFAVSRPFGDIKLNVLLCVGAVAGAVWATAGYVDWLKSVKCLLLGNRLQFRPGWRPLPPADVESVTFGPDPAEDYDELSATGPTCEATVRLRPGRRFHLTISTDDAARLAEWAANKGIVVTDPHGYSTRGARSEPT